MYNVGIHVFALIRTDWVSELIRSQDASCECEYNQLHVHVATGFVVTLFQFGLRVDLLHTVRIEKHNTPKKIVHKFLNRAREDVTSFLCCLKD